MAAKANSGLGCLPSPSRDRENALLEKSDADPKHTAVHIEMDSPRKQRRNLFTPALIASLILTSLLGLAGFGMAAWATWKLNNANRTTFALTTAILVADPQDGPRGYSTMVNLFRGTGYWAPRKAMPFFRSDHAVVTWNDTAYLVGGQTVDAANTTQKIVLNKLVAYDAVYSEYRNLTDMPEPRCRFGAAVVGSVLYVFGGYNNTDFSAISDTVMTYNFATNTWAVLPTRTPTLRSDTCQGVIGGKIYVAGGYDFQGNTLNVIEVFDPATNTWTRAPVNLATGRGDCGAIALNNQLYVMGGTQLVQPPGVDCSVEWWKCYPFLSSVERYTPANNSVDQLAPMRSPRGDFAIMESNTSTRILVAGGEYNDLAVGVTRMLAQPWVEEYDIADNYWTPKAPLPEGRFRMMGTKAGGQLLIFGGQPSCPAVNQVDDTLCYQNDFNSVLSFTDVSYPNVYILTRNPGTTPNDVL